MTKPKLTKAYTIAMCNGQTIKVTQDEVAFHLFMTQALFEEMLDKLQMIGTISCYTKDKQ